MAVIVVVGSLNMDLVIRTPRQPFLGETVIGGSFGTTGGGKGSNQALACARLGAEAHMIGCVGNDDFGRRLKNTLLEAKVDCSFLETCSGSGTGVAVVTVTNGGENTIVLAPGANSLLDEAILNRAKDVFKGADAALFQMETPLETVIAGLKMARRMGCKTVLTPSPACALPQEVWGLVDCLILNETELAFYALGADFDPSRGVAGVDEQRLLDVSQQLIKWGTKRVVVTQEARGGFVVAKNKIFRFESFKVHSLDTTGVRDSFCAALSVKLSEGTPLEEAVQFASAAGALASTRYGAHPSMPWRHEVEALLENTGGIKK